MTKHRMKLIMTACVAALTTTTAFSIPDSDKPSIEAPAAATPNIADLAAYLLTEAAASCKPPETVNFTWKVFPIGQDDHGNTIQVDAPTTLKRDTALGCGTWTGTMTVESDLTGTTWLRGNPPAGEPPRRYDDHTFDPDTTSIVTGFAQANASIFDWPDWPQDYPNAASFTGRYWLDFDFLWSYGSSQPISYSPALGTAIGMTCEAVRPDAGSTVCAVTEYQTDGSGMIPD